MTGKHAAHYQTDANGNLELTTKPISAAVNGKSVGLSFESLYAYETYDQQTIKVSVKTTEKDAQGQAVWQEVPYSPIGSWLSNMWLPYAAQLPENTDFDALQIKINCSAKPSADFYLDSLGLCTQVIPYAFFKGTSMAAPSITGAVAVLAERYPNDSAEQLAARVKGSVVKTDNLSNLCSSGGYFSMTQADDPIPVINSVSRQADRTIVIDGYFFGKSGAVTIGGKAGKVTQRSDTQIVCTEPAGFEAGFQEVVVTDGSQSGRQSFNVGMNNDLYENSLNVPNEINQLMPLSMFADGDNIYTAFYDEVSDNNMIYQYNIKNGRWVKELDAQGRWMCYAAESKLLMVNDNTNKLQVYDTVSKSSTVLETTYRLSPYVEFFEMNGQFYVVNIFEIMDNTYDYVDGIYSLDLTTGAMSRVGSLSKPVSVYSAGSFGDDMMLLTEDSDRNMGLEKVVWRDGRLETAVVSENITLYDISSQLSMYVLPAADGVYYIGPVSLDETADTFRLGYDQPDHFAPYAKRAASTPVHNLQAAYTQGKIYVLGQTSAVNPDSGLQTFFRSTDIGFGAANVSYSSHIQNLDWQAAVQNGALSGTTGESLQMEALKIDAQTADGTTIPLSIDVHEKDNGWVNGYTNGQIAGTTGENRRLEAVRIRIADQTLADQYDIYYQVHGRNYGWDQGWKKNGEEAGTTGQALRLEAIKIQLVPKGQNVSE